MYKYKGPNWTYHNYVPEEDIELIDSKEYSVAIHSNAEQIIINGIPQTVEPSAYFVVFESGSWIPYMPHRIWEHWEKV